MSETLRCVGVALLALGAYHLSSFTAGNDDVHSMVKEEAAQNAPHFTASKSHVLIQYCSSWSYRQTFHQVSSILQERAQEKLEVQGVAVPTPPEQRFAANVVFLLQLTLWGVLFAGEAVFNTFKMLVPGVLALALENKMVSFMVIWMVGNAISGKLLDTGEFEIQCDGKLIWSSLEEERLPTLADVMQAFSKSGVDLLKLVEQS
eukprot:TRINITY_DN85793_c0_g1_i1.p1 TRINITY_DN85793_c0_g1~~TRINITY_DN85793_c0_g1_i1.p1  ORF type:complete len:214 (-),score=53.02 TRINITY_DN85793_c0_g1_i1:168-779(-)